MKIVVYGAGGALGGLVVRALAALGVRPVLAGRRVETLDPLADGVEHGGVSVAAIDDPAALASLLEPVDVLVNCATPSAVCGPPLVDAAIAAGTHYVDPSGEQVFIKRLFDRWGDASARAGVALAPAMGFDYALGDCLAHLTAQGREPAAEVTVAYAITGSGVSANSAQFAAETPGGGEVVYRARAWRPVPFEVDRASFTFPEPVGRRQMARYGAGEVVTVPRHVDTDAVTTLITASSLSPPSLLPLFPYLRPVVGLVRRTPLRALLGVAAKVMARGGGGGRGVNAEPAQAPEPDKGSFVVAVEVRARDGSTARGIAEGGDFHGVTAATLAYGATVLARGNRPNGALAPAQAVGPAELLDHLGALGVRWRVEAG